MEHDWFVAEKSRGFVSGKERYTTILDAAPITNGTKEWFCSACKTSNVWTRKKCRIRDGMNSVVVIPLSQAGDGRAASYMCGMIHRRVTKASAQADFAGGCVDSEKNKSSATVEGQEEPEAEGSVPVTTTPKVDRNAVRAKRTGLASR